jgi:glycine betaine transporter
VFGGTGLHLELFDTFHLAEAVKEDTTTALFLILEQLPLGTIVAFIATLLIMIFFITSADSATFVLGIVAALPFAVVLIGTCVSLLKALQAKNRERRQKEKRQRQKLRQLLEGQENA